MMRAKTTATRMATPMTRTRTRTLAVCLSALTLLVLVNIARTFVLVVDGAAVVTTIHGNAASDSATATRPVHSRRWTSSTSLMSRHAHHQEQAIRHRRLHRIHAMADDRRARHQSKATPKKGTNANPIASSPPPPYHAPALVHTLFDLRHLAPLPGDDETMLDSAALRRVLNYAAAVVHASRNMTHAVMVRDALRNVALHGQLALLPPLMDERLQMEVYGRKSGGSVVDEDVREKNDYGAMYEADGLVHEFRRDDDDDGTTYRKQDSSIDDLHDINGEARRDAMFWFWRYRNQMKEVPEMVRAIAAHALQQSMDRLQLELTIGHGDDSTHDHLIFRQWEAQQVALASNDPSFNHHCVEAILDVCHYLINPGNVREFPRMLQALENARGCDAQSNAWNSFRMFGVALNPWDLFYTADRYFEEHGTPVDVQQDMMARLAYHIYRLPRHQRAEDSWPMDVIIMLDEYFHLGDSMSTNEDASYHDDEQHYDNDSANTADWNDVALTPAQRWLKFLIVIQCSLGEYVDSTVALQPVADSIGPSFSALQSFRRALLREEPRVNDVLSLYDTFTSRYLHHRIRTDALHKSHSHLLTPMPPTMKLITRKDYFRLLELMHWQLDEEEFCSRVQGVNSDMALFGIAPNLIKQDGFDVEECERWWTMMVDELTRR